MAKKSKYKQESPENENGEVAYIAEELEQAAPEVVEELVDFETWYSIREPKIPGHHHREIIKADFKGRKVPALATMAQFDEALKKYGVKLV
jgi:hypothetical protein